MKPTEKTLLFGHNTENRCAKVNSSSTKRNENIKRQEWKQKNICIARLTTFHRTYAHTPCQETDDLELYEMHCKWENLKRNSWILEMDYKSKSQQCAPSSSANIAAEWQAAVAFDSGQTEHREASQMAKHSTFYLSIQYYVFYIFYTRWHQTDSHWHCEHALIPFIGRSTSQHKWTLKKKDGEKRNWNCIRNVVTDVHLFNSTRTSSSLELAP